jgi:DNA-binding transcriptional LysR family regulator
MADELAAALGDSLDNAEATLANLRARSEDVTGVIHLAGPAEFVGERLMQKLASLTIAGLQFRIRLGGREAIYAQLLGGEVDLAVTASIPNEPRLDSTAIASERLVLVAGGKPADAPEAAFIHGTAFCAYDFDLPLIREWCAVNSLPIPSQSPSVVIPDLRALVRCVEAGELWSVLPDYLVASGISAGRLHRPYPAFLEPENRLYLAWARGSLRSPRVAMARSLLLAE